MGDNIVKLVFQTIASGSGFAEVTKQTSELQKKLGKLSQGAQILGSALGNVGGMFGRSLAMLLQGGIWGAAAEVVKFVIEKTGLLKKKTDELNASLETTRNRFDEIKRFYSESLGKIDEEIGRKKKILEITKEQEKAELAVAAAQAKARGDKVGASKIAEQIAKLEGDTAKQNDALTVEQAYRKMEAARKAASASSYVSKDGEFDAKAWEKQRRRLNSSIAAQERKIQDEYAEASRRTRDEKSPVLEKIRDLEKELEMSKQARAKHIELAKAEREIAKNLKKAIQDHKDAVELAKVTASKSKETKTNSESATKDAVLEGLNEGKRKVDERKNELKNPVVPVVGGTFAQHFELWRDPAAAQEAQDAAKQKTLDMKAFYKAVNRYGGKGKIDEAAELMRAGDDEALQTRLAEWRKSSKFNGQTEQMVLAAAAKKNEDAAKKALEDIRSTSAEIDRKLEAIKAAFEVCSE